MQHGSSVAIFRIFDMEKAIEFYCDYLGYTKAWVHQFGDEMPCYVCVKSGDSEIHLSEHYGDCTPGSAVRINIVGIKEYHTYLLGKKYSFCKPGLKKAPWGHYEITVSDPFANKIIFWEEISES
ncbi:MAG: glyoxalase superfamily protein [Cyanobacteria bacterium J06629_18]